MDQHYYGRRSQVFPLNCTSITRGGTRRRRKDNDDNDDKCADIIQRATERESEESEKHNPITLSNCPFIPQKNGYLL